ncbi:MAG: hypothetical protein ACRDSH_19745 [Pseudonocardiaceae bacterium]
MSDTVIVAPLDGLDAIVERVGDDVLIHLSAAVPEWTRPAVIPYLLRAARAASGAQAEVRMPLGEAMHVAREVRRSVPTQTVPAPKKLALAAAAAGLVLPGIGAAAALLLFGSSPRVAPPEAAPAPVTAPQAPTLPDPAIARDAGMEVPAPSPVPVSIHPPTRIARAVPLTVNAAEPARVPAAPVPEPQQPVQAPTQSAEPPMSGDVPSRVDTAWHPRVDSTQEAQSRPGRHRRLLGRDEKISGSALPLVCI